MDTLSSADEVGFGSWRLVKNATTRSSRNRQRGGGWRRLFADDSPYNNADLHSQLLDHLGYYFEYLGHAMGGGDQTGVGYPYQYPGGTTPATEVFPPADGPFCPVYHPDFGLTYEDCTIFYPFVGYPYVFHTPITGACDAGSPWNYPYSYVYTSCADFIPGEHVDSYGYGYSFPVYSSEFSYDYIYCGNELFNRTGCREAITMIGEIVTSTGRKLIASTMSRVYEYNQSSGNWRVIADGLGNSGYVAEQCTCNAVRGMMATLGVTMFYTNSFNEPLVYMLGSEGSQCGLQALVPITDLVALGITRAGGVVEFKGFILFYDITENGERMGGTVIWSDLEDGEAFIEGDTSFAGRATIAIGETILNAAKLGNWLIFYTDRRIIRCSLVGGDDVFNFEDIYTDEDGSAALRYKYSLIQCGSKHIYLGGDNDVYAFTQFDTRPVMVNWITKASGMISKGIAEDDAIYEPINEDACNMVTGGWNERTQEAWLSWPTGDNVCPNVTLRYNLKFGAADLVDHGFTAFLSFRKELRPTVGQWLEDLGVCDRGEVVGVGAKDGPLCAGGDEVTPLLYMRNETEDASLPVHPQSLCAALTNKTLDDFCVDCAAPATFIMASATDFTLKQAEEDIYYRERLAFQPAPCETIEFTAEPEPEPPEPEVEDMPLDEAIYDSGRDVIFAVRGGYIFKLNADTGAMEDSARFAAPAWGDSHLCLDAGTDKIFASIWFNYSNLAKFPIWKEKFLYEIDPDTLLVTNSYTFDVGLFFGGSAAFREGPRQLIAVQNKIYGLFHQGATSSTNFYEFDPATGLFDAAGTENTNSSCRSDLAYDADLDLFWVANISGAGAFERATLNQTLTINLPSNHLTKGLAYRAGFIYFTMQEFGTVLPQEIKKKASDDTGSTITIDTGRPNATPFNIRYRASNDRLYVPCGLDDTVVIIDPNTDTVESVKTGFDSPWDVVFTATKAFAVQHGSQGLKEIL